MAGVGELLVLILAIVASSASAASGGDKDTHIKLYWHDVLSGPNPTAVLVAQAAGTNTSKTFFGGVRVIDDALTDGPDLNSSKIVGRAQGIYIGAGRDALSLMMNMNFVFEAGEYNGSTVAIMGRNAAYSTVREMAVVGGTGARVGTRRPRRTPSTSRQATPPLSTTSISSTDRSASWSTASVDLQRSGCWDLGEHPYDVLVLQTMPCHASLFLVVAWCQVSFLFV